MGQSLTSGFWSFVCNWWWFSRKVRLNFRGLNKHWRFVIIIDNRGIRTRPVWRVFNTGSVAIVYTQLCLSSWRVRTWTTTSPFLKTESGPRSWVSPVGTDGPKVSLFFQSLDCSPSPGLAFAFVVNPQINYMNWWKKKFFFAWNVLKHKVNH